MFGQRKKSKKFSGNRQRKHCSRKFAHHMKAQQSVIIEKGLSHFLTSLKTSKAQKVLHHCLTTLKVFNTEKRAPSLSYDFYSY